KQGPTQFCCARTLNGHGAKLRAAVHEAAGRGALTDAARALGKLLLLEMLLEPTEIFLCASGVDHEQKRLLGGSVNDQIVNDAAAFVEQKSVLPHADGESGDIV